MRSGRLRLHGRAVVDAVLHAQLDVQQAQEVPPRWWCPRCLRPPRERRCSMATVADAVDRVHLRPAGRLHDAAGVGVERFEVAALAFVEQDVEGERTCPSR